MDVVRRSRTYAAVRTLRRWADGSTVVGLAGRPRVLRALAGALVLASVASVLGSNLGAGLKFLSFLLCFVIVAAIARPFVEPSTE